MAISTLQILSIVLLFLGESPAIYSEISGASKVDTQNKITYDIFGKFFVLILASGAMLLGGYFIGILVFKNIWIVSVVSIISILIVEPILVFLIFRQFPTNGAIIGLFLGSIGFVATLLVN